MWRTACCGALQSVTPFQGAAVGTFGALLWSRPPRPHTETTAEGSAEKPVGQGVLLGGAIGIEPVTSAV